MAPLMPVVAARRSANATRRRVACPLALQALIMAVSSAQFRALDAVERCPHGPCVLSVPALGAGQAARVAREGGSRARLASGTGRGFVALRGGSGRYDGDSRRYIDAQLRGEILEVFSLP